jgi:alanine racemase
MLRYPEAHGNMVRVGILQYGLWPNGETYVEFVAKNPTIEILPKRLITWKSSIMQLKHVPANEYIGYGNSYYTPKDTIIGVVPVGYGHGFSRSLSNLGRVLVNGCRVSVIGLVNMNALVINLNDVPDVKRGDDVILIGRQGEMDVSIGSFSDLSHQLNYESITRLDQAIPRIITE